MPSAFSTTPGLNALLTTVDPLVQESNDPVVQVAHSKSVTVVFENKSSESLNLTIFNLQPLYGITQVYPTTTICEDIDPGDTREIPFDMILPDDLRNISCKSADDILKAFVTVDRTSFRSLTMAGINTKPGSQVQLKRGGSNSLQSLLNKLAHSSRNASYALQQWDTREISVRVLNLAGLGSNTSPVQPLHGEVIKHLSTVIATDRDDIEILPSQQPVVGCKLRNLVVNSTSVRGAQQPGEMRCLTRQTKVRWRCVSAKTAINRSVGSDCMSRDVKRFLPGLFQQIWRKGTFANNQCHQPIRCLKTPSAIIKATIVYQYWRRLIQEYADFRETVTLSTLVQELGAE